MESTFEKQFSEILSNMVAACIGYCKNNAEKVFIHISHEGGMYGWDFFFQIHEVIVAHGFVDYALHPGDTPISRKEALDGQGPVLKVLSSEGMKLVKLFKDCHRELPTEIRLVYDARTNGLDTKCRYDPVWSKKPNGWLDDVEFAWMEEEARKLGTVAITPYCHP